MNNTIVDILEKTNDVLKTAKKHKQSLAGNGFYASKLSGLHAQVAVAMQQLRKDVEKYDDTVIKQAIEEINIGLNVIFQNKSDFKEKSEAKKKIQFLYKTAIEPVFSKGVLHTPTDNLFPLEIVKGTRGYIESISAQACGAYDQGWYDASAVMLRRLLEILIIESFEAHGLTSKIKKTDGTFYYLQDLVTITLNEPSWTLGRNVKKGLPNLRELGNQSAHGRRYTAKKGDIEDIRREIRLTIEELVLLSNLKR
jgi:hypothetical protein